MAMYTLELELFSLLNASTSDFEIWADGSQLGGGYSITSSGTSISLSVSYAGALPSSLEFRFNDLASGTPDQIEVRSVKINDRYVNIGNYLSSNILSDGGSSTVNIASSDYIFDGSADPAASEFTTGVTRTFTAGSDFYNGYNKTTAEVFDMLGGSDSARLGSGNDKVTGGAGNDVLRGGAGNDLLFGDADDDRLYGGAGDDTLHGGTGNDRIYGKSGDDEIYGGAGDDRLNGHADNDIITGGAGDDNLIGGSGDDSLFGDGDDDKLIGGSGNDTLDGGDGNDLLYGGAGADQMDGGDGIDTLIGDSGDDIMNGNDGDDVLYGRDDNDTLNGGAGSDKIYGGDGNDTIDGGANADTIYGDATGINLLVNGGFEDTSNGVGSGVTPPNWIKTGPGGGLYNFPAGRGSEGSYAYPIGGWTSSVGGDISQIVTTQIGETYTLTFDAGAAYGTPGTSGTLSVQVLNGAVPIVTDSITDTNLSSGLHSYGYSFTATSVATTMFFELTASTGEIDFDLDNVAVYMTDVGVDTISGGAGDDIIYGEAGDDILSGGDDDDILYGGDDNDTLDGGAGDDTLDGGADNDTASYASSSNALTASLFTGVGTGEGSDTFTNIENLEGGSGNDVLTGDAGVNILTGNDGGDTLNGGADDDTLNGGAGNDTIYADDAENSGVVAYYKLDETAGTVVTDYSGNGNHGTYVDGTPSWNSTGGRLAGAIDFSGKTLEEINAGTWDVSGSGITLSAWIYQDNVGVDSRIISKTNGSSSVSHDWAFLINDNASGSEDRLHFRLRTVGGEQNNELEGVDFSDYLDTWTHVAVTYDDTTDLITYYINGAAAGTDTHGFGGAVITGSGKQIGIGNQPNDAYGDRQFDGSLDEIRVYERELSASEISNLYTFDFNSSGTTGADIANGGDGDDIIYGGGGIDTLNGDADDDTIFGQEGNDIIDGGAGNDEIFGGEDNDTIDGGAGADVIEGGSGNDTITAGDGDDILYGGTGDDIIYADGTATPTVTSTQGWSYQYYDLASTPTTLVLSGFSLNANRDNTFAATGSGITQDTDPNVFDGTSDYALKFETTLTITTAGTYTFQTTSDDGSELFLDGVEIVSNGGTHAGVTVTSAGQVLASGTYILEATFFEATGGEIMEITMSGADTGNVYVNLENYAGANVVTYSGSGTDGDDIINGGAGTDTLYGGGGADTFLFEAASAFAETDTIMDFSTTDNDKLDISDILTGAFSGDIKEYLQFTSDSGDTLVQVDANGTTGGTSFQTIARIDGIVGIDEVALYNAGDIII